MNIWYDFEVAKMEINLNWTYMRAWVLLAASPFTLGWLPRMRLLMLFVVLLLLPLILLLPLWLILLFRLLLLLTMMLLMLLLLLLLLSVDDRRLAILQSFAWLRSKQIFNPAQNRSNDSIPLTGVTRRRQSMTPCGKPFDPSSCHRASISDNRTNPVRLSSIISNNVRMLETNFFGKFSNGLAPFPPQLLLPECEFRLFVVFVLLPVLWQLLFDDCCTGGKWWCVATECFNTTDWPSITFIGGTHLVIVFLFIMLGNFINSATARQIQCPLKCSKLWECRFFISFCVDCYCANNIRCLKRLRRQNGQIQRKNKNKWWKKKKKWKMTKTVPIRMRSLLQLLFA